MGLGSGLGCAHSEPPATAELELAHCVRALFHGASSGGDPSSSMEVAPPSQALTSTRTCEPRGDN